MTAILLVGLLTFLAPAGGQTPPPQQQVPRPSAEDIRREREAAAAQRAAEERQIMLQEAQRKQFLDSLRPTPFNTDLIMPDESCLASSSHADMNFNLDSLPLDDWLRSNDTRQIPWKVHVTKPDLRLDQRHEIQYTVRISLKNVPRNDGNQEYAFITGVNSPDGERLVAPKVSSSKVTIPDRAGNTEIRHSECVFLRPGDYVLWIVFYHPGSGSHNLAQRRIQIAPSEDDPLAHISSSLPVAEFPISNSHDPMLNRPRPRPLSLDVSNRRPLRFDLVAISSFPEQWYGSPHVLESHNSALLAATSVLAQIKLSDGMLSVTSLDLLEQNIPFRQSHFEEMDWATLEKTLTNVADSNKVSISTIEQRKQRGAFLRQFMEADLNEQDDRVRVIVLISSSTVFDRGSDLTSIAPPANCNCRVYHIRFRHSRADVFDDLGKIIKPLRPKTFNVSSARQFREALGTIMRDVETWGGNER